MHGKGKIGNRGANCTPVLLTRVIVLHNFALDALLSRARYRVHYSFKINNRKQFHSCVYTIIPGIIVVFLGKTLTFLNIKLSQTLTILNINTRKNVSKS